MNRSFFTKGLSNSALADYADKVTSFNDENSLKAMKAMTKTLKKSLTSNPHTLQNQMQFFGKDGAAARKSKLGQMIIKPNAPAISRRVWPGSMPAPQGRRLADRRGATTITTTTEEGTSHIVADSTVPVYTTKRHHNLSQTMCQPSRH